MTTPILQLLNVESNYGPVQALRGVSLSVSEGKIVTVLGANGAGKTTTLKTISGIIKNIYAIARLAAETQVKREHFFPDATAPAAPSAG